MNGTHCPCGRAAAKQDEPTAKSDTLCSDHWHELPASLKNAWRIAEREGGESFALITERIREFTKLNVLIDLRERRAMGADRYTRDALRGQIRPQVARRGEILQRFGIRETLAA